MIILKLLILVACIASFTIVGATAQESSEYHLRVKSQPNILFIGGGGFYSAGTTVTVDKAPETWQEYTFIGWKIDGRWADENPISIRMDSSHTAEAIYSKDVAGSIIVDTIPRVAEITIDGEIYLPDELPATFDWEAGSEHIISIQTTVKESTTTRYIFDSWKDQESSDVRSITVNDKETNYIALYKTQHFLKPITEHGIVVGGGWKDEGSSVSFELESENVIDKKNENIRYIFDSWNLGDYPNSPRNALDLEEPTTIKADWDTQYKLDLRTNVEDYDLFGTGWYDQARQVALIAEQSLESQNSDTKYVFDRWVSKGPNPVIIPNAHSPSTTITLEEPYVIEAQYKKSFQVNVWTPFSTPLGDGFYAEGEVAEITLSNTEVVVSPNKVKKIFSGWDTHGARTMDLSQDDPDLVGRGALGQNLLVFVDGPTNVTAEWKSQYYLDLQTTDGKTKGSGWYDLGRMVPISVDEKSVPVGMWSAKTFDRWTGDVEGESVNERVLMNGPKSAIAEWKTDNTPGIINGIILAAVAGIAGLVYTKTRKNQLLNKTIKNNLGGMKEASFDKFFSLRNQNSNPEQNAPNFYSKPKGTKGILDWLLGRNN